MTKDSNSLPGYGNLRRTRVMVQGDNAISFFEV